MNGVLDALIAAAAADVAGHRVPDLVMRRLRILRQERSCLHDLPGLAEAALRHVDLAPRLLHGMIAGRMQALDGRDLAVCDVGHRRDAGARGLVVDHHGAGAAQRLAAAILRARQPELVAQIPQQRQARIAIPGLFLSVDFHLDHDCPRSVGPMGVSSDLVDARGTTCPSVRAAVQLGVVGKLLMIAVRDGYRTTQARVLSKRAGAALQVLQCKAATLDNAPQGKIAKATLQQSAVANRITAKERMPRRHRAGEAPSRQEGTLQLIRLVRCGPQAAFAFATCVAIASIKAGDRQSYGSSPSSFSRARISPICSGFTPDSMTEETKAAKPGAAEPCSWNSSGWTKSSP